ncbi:hypothetical protein QCA50_003502 [Cerrena zonata]|uniref:Dephospho-CoA kinase n=1 Tax=Cerrena zonata TaxID=2478898 RepID=A0AAW0GJW6_9APHY
MLVVGLTGGIATGKSTVSTLLKSYKIPVVDADVIAREVVLPGTSTLAKIVKTFGEDVLQPDGTLDRPKLGSIVFSDESKRKQLNAIVHPAVRKKMFWEVMRYWWRGEKMCVLDVPLLIEGGLWRFVATVVVVYCSQEIQLQRLMARDRSSREDASSRLRAQMPIVGKLDYADIVIENSGPVQELEPQLYSMLKKLRKKAGWSWRVSWLCPPWGFFSAIGTLFFAYLRRRRRLERSKTKASHT